MNDAQRRFAKQRDAAVKKLKKYNSPGYYHSVRVLHAWDSLDGGEQSDWLLAARREGNKIRAIDLFAKFFNEPQPKPFLRYRRETGLNLILPDQDTN